MRSDKFETWKADMVKQGLYDSIAAITSATPEQYWAYATACNLFKKIQMNALDTHLANQLFKDVEGAWLPGNPSILPLPGPDDFPFPVLTPYDPGPFLPTEVFFYQKVAAAEGGPEAGVAGVPKTDDEFLNFVDSLWGFPDLETFQSVSKTLAVESGGVLTTAFDFFDQISGGNWPVLYKNVKLAVAGQIDPAKTYFKAQFHATLENERVTWETVGASIGGAIGAAVGAGCTGPGAAAGVYVGNAGGAIIGGMIGSAFD